MRSQVEEAEVIIDDEENDDEELEGIFGSPTTVRSPPTTAELGFPLRSPTTPFETTFDEIPLSSPEVGEEWPESLDRVARVSKNPFAVAVLMPKPTPPLPLIRGFDPLEREDETPLELRDSLGDD
jgi:hypothetical protein